ncbi:MAG: hypothetical protein EDM05_005160 [Leptolyngbya sp. IPPAS B-1204]|nr:hypothetical protein [Elainella sp. C42_A2020_010]RNJ65480.1 MAG: hypothetical protein EDM05_31035 [Leptolyngbya sp. IPPAS B-1204]
MGRISDLVDQALKTGYLSLAAEDQLRSLLQVKNTPEELTAFLQLQRAAMEGLVKQESRELAHLQKLPL